MFKNEEQELYRHYEATAEHHQAIGFFPPAQLSFRQSLKLSPLRATLGNALATIWLLPRNIAVTLMRLYRRVISPLYGDVCRYYPSCSAYALQSIHKRGFVLGIILGSWRIIRCNPWAEGGLDKPREALFQHYCSTEHGYVFLNPDNGKLSEKLKHLSNG